MENIREQKTEMYKGKSWGDHHAKEKKCVCTVWRRAPVSLKIKIFLQVKPTSKITIFYHNRKERLILLMVMFMHLNQV